MLCDLSLPYETAAGINHRDLQGPGAKRDVLAGRARCPRSAFQLRL